MGQDGAVPHGRGERKVWSSCCCHLLSQLACTPWLAPNSDSHLLQRYLCEPVLTNLSKKQRDSFKWEVPGDIVLPDWSSLGEQWAHPMESNAPLDEERWWAAGGTFEMKTSSLAHPCQEDVFMPFSPGRRWLLYCCLTQGTQSQLGVFPKYQSPCKRVHSRSTESHLMILYLDLAWWWWWCSRSV